MADEGTGAWPPRPDRGFRAFASIGAAGGSARGTDSVPASYRTKNHRDTKTQRKRRPMNVQAAFFSVPLCLCGLFAFHRFRVNLDRGHIRPSTLAMTASGHKIHKSNFINLAE